MSEWCIVRVFPDWNYGQDGDEVADVIGPIRTKEHAEKLAVDLEAKGDRERFTVHEMCPVTP